MLSEKTPDGVWLTYIGGHVSAGYRIGDEKAKIAADAFNKRFEDGEPVFIQGVEFQKTADGIRVIDKNNVIGNIVASWDKAFEEWHDIEDFNEEGYRRLMDLDKTSISEEELDKLFNEELEIARQNKKVFTDSKKNQKTPFWKKLFGCGD
mgnify:FL=1